MGVLLTADFGAFRLQRKCLRLLRHYLLDSKLSSLATSYLSELRHLLTESDFKLVDPEGFIHAAEFAARVIAAGEEQPGPTRCFIHLAMEEEFRRNAAQFKKLSANTRKGTADDKLRFALALSAATELSRKEIVEYFSDIGAASVELQRMALYRLGQFGDRELTGLIEPSLDGANHEIRLEGAVSLIRLLSGTKGNKRFLIAGAAPD